jgi:pyruvate formate lyase activating enzyme
MIETALYDKLPGNKVRCNVCAVRCLIKEGEDGICRTRVNRDGILYSLIYNRVSTIHIDPIEKKPLYHFYPASRILSLGSLGCNFQCPGCQNWQISHADANQIATDTTELTAEDTVRLMREHGCGGICWTYNDPTIWLEYTLDCAKQAKAHGFYTAYITNGFTTPEALDLIGPYLDAFRVDLKGHLPATYKKIAKIGRLDVVLDMAVRAKEKWGMHVECVTNLTPTINDSPQELREIARAIHARLGPETPWHVTRFYPYLDLSHLPPTPILVLERTYEIGREEGLKYVYMGNVPGHPGENTYCHACARLLIRRDGYRVAEYHLEEDRCGYCRAVIPGRFIRKPALKSTQPNPVLWGPVRSA